VLGIARAARAKAKHSQEKLKRAYGQLLNSNSRVVGQAKRFSAEVATGVKRSTDVLQQLALENGHEIDGLRKVSQISVGRWCGNDRSTTTPRFPHHGMPIGCQAAKANCDVGRSERVAVRAGQQLNSAPILPRQRGERLCQVVARRIDPCKDDRSPQPWQPDRAQQASRLLDPQWFHELPLPQRQ